TCSIPESDTNETVLLKPGEARVIETTGTVTADPGSKTFNIALSSDIDKNETVTINYGYVETLNINVLPAYPEGNLAVGYEISNVGGLAFKDSITAEIYTAGGAAPIYTFDRNFNLYPGEAPLTGTLEMFLLPGNYILKTKSGRQPIEQESAFIVHPSGIGTVTLTTPTNFYPVGANDIAFRITNNDTSPGHIPIVINISPQNNTTLSKSFAGSRGRSHSVSVLKEPLAAGGTVTKSYYIKAGESAEDLIHADLTATGDYTLSITGAKLSAPLTRVIRVVAVHDVGAT
ncbi:MAG: hypothetical protein GY757_36925, partial [bacterium]|nr:hypothetical protein [bacterium]